jgi:transcriptional regulator with XRE-family HTH domain
MSQKKEPKPIEPIYAAIGARVRYIRDVIGMDQTTLAKQTGLTRTSLTNFEAGNQRCPLHVIEKMATALNTTPKHLMKGIWL